MKVCMGWRRSGLVLAAVAVIVLALAGCATLGARNAPPDPAIAQRAALPSLPGVRAWADEVPGDPAAALKRQMPSVGRLAHRSQRTADGRPIVDILALSGGGGDGAFGAGLLAGWSARGDRPTFDIVTGVSAGAIIAPFAFLGRGYDARLKDIWTRYGTGEIITAQILPGLLGGSALADTAPMEELIAQYVDRRMLRAIAAEYRAGRILLIGTTNLDAQRPVVWNMGEIAVNGNADALALFRKIILASAAIPGAFPPVAIDVEAQGQSYEELHVDGGTTREIFISPVEAPLKSFDPLYDVPPLRRIWIVKNGKLAPEYDVVPKQTIALSVRAIYTLIKSQSLGDIYRVWRTTRDAGAEFNLLAVPPTFTLKAKEAFDPAYQSALFDQGFALGRAGIWAKRPPVQRPITAAR